MVFNKLAHKKFYNEIDYNNQKYEISKSFEIYYYLKISKKDWMLCYPFCSHNKDTIKILKKFKCFAALDVKLKEYSIDKHNIYNIPKFDTNDFTQ